MSLGPVVRQVKDALDGVPIHVRQLAAMFKQHGSVHKRKNSDINDLDRVPPDLRDGWRTDSWHTPDRIVGSGKPNRPYPGEYLDDGYIRQHLDRFEDGATRFYRAESLDQYGPGNAGTTFVFPTTEIDDIIRQADGDPGRLGEMLGLGREFFVDADGNAVDIVRADFNLDEITNGNLRMPRGNEGGANAQWIPGGYLPEGIPEAVFNVSSIGTGTYTQFYVD